MKTVPTPGLSDPGSMPGGYGEWKVGDPILDTYEVVRIAAHSPSHFAKGGMGRVYRVFHRAWAIDLALKVAATRLFDSKGRSERFEEECQMWVNLALHPNTVTCHYIRRIDGFPAIFAEFVDGGSLTEWITLRTLYRGASTNVLARIFDVAIQAAWGLHHAHQQNLVHQDVKPSNIMMTADGVAKITDFGVARARSRTGPIHAAGEVQHENGATLRGMTEEYRSPEQAAAAVAMTTLAPDDRTPRLTRHTDMWSWGLCILEMFSGRRTWTDGLAAPDSLADYLEAPEGVEGIPRMPAPVADLLRQCFQQHPEDRCRDMADVAVTLRDIYHRVIGAEYERPIPKLTELRASALNNKALSLLDLGDEGKSRRMFEQALRADPLHPEATYNRGLLEWRSARLPDDGLLAQLNECHRQRPDRSQVQMLAGLVHLERGDVSGAIQALESCRSQNPDEADVLAALKRAECQPSTAGRCLNILSDHQGNLTDLALSSNGKTLLSSAWDETVRIWDVASMESRYALRGHGKAVTCVAISRDGMSVVTGGLDGKIGFWSLPSARNTRWITLDAKAQSVDISRDGRWCAVACDDNQVRVYDLGSDRRPRILESHSATVSAARFSPDVSRLVTASWDDTVITWDVATWSPMVCTDVYASKLMHLAVSPAGDTTLVGGADATMRLVNLRDGKTLVTFRGHGGAVNSVAWTPDGSYAVSGSSDHTVRLWDISTGRCLRTFSEHTSSVNTVTVTIDGRQAISGGSDNVLRVWDLSRGQTSPFAVNRPRAAHIASAMEAENTTRWVSARLAVEKGDISEALELLQQIRRTNDFGLSHKTLDLLAGAGRRSVRNALSAVIPTVLRHATGREATCAAIEPNDREAAIEAIALRKVGGWPLRSVPDSFGRVAMVGSRNGDVQIFDLHAGQAIHTFESQGAYVESVAFLPGGRHCQITPRLKDARTYELNTGRRIELPLDSDDSTSEEPYLRRALKHSRAFLERECASWDGIRRLLCADHGSLLLVDDQKKWRIPLETEAGELTTCVAMLPDGRFGFSSGWGRAIRLWDLSTAQCIRTLEGHRSHVTCLACSPDGRWLVSAAEDGEVRLWQLVWDYTFPGLADSAPGLEKAITVLLNRYEPEVCAAWSLDLYCRLLLDLQSLGYGWVRLDAVHEAAQEQFETD